MYTGTMIEDLIAAVARAEEHAHELEAASAEADPLAELGPMYANFVYEAPYMVGAA